MNDQKDNHTIAETLSSQTLCLQLEVLYRNRSTVFTFLIYKLESLNSLLLVSSHPHRYQFQEID